MPIPYLGSKRKSAQRIYNVIKGFNPEANTIVDLFCGGLAITEVFYKNGWSIIANDKNKYVIALAREAIKGRFNDKNFTPEFISRDEFIEVTTNPDKYDDWYVGYIQCIWSFGNNQSGYLFGKEVEPIKKAGHNLVVFKDRTEIDKLIPEIPNAYINALLKLDNWHRRRIALIRISKKLKTRILELERLQQLERLQRLQRLQRLELNSKSYNEIDIPKDAIIYCDPPYQGTAEYKEGNFNHDKFWEWVRNMSKKNKIYISEYKAPDDFKPLFRFSQKSSLQGGLQKHDNQPKETLFVPIGQEL